MLNRRAFLGVLLAGPFASVAALKAAIAAIAAIEAAPAQAWKVHAETYLPHNMLGSVVRVAVYSPDSDKMYGGALFVSDLEQRSARFNLLEAKARHLEESFIALITKEHPDTNAPLLRRLIRKALNKELATLGQAA
jgi:hypothetical protein